MASSPPQLLDVVVIEAGPADAVAALRAARLGAGDARTVFRRSIPPRLQWLRGPRRLAAYDKHLGPPTGPDRDSAGRLGPHAATKVTRHAPAGRTKFAMPVQAAGSLGILELVIARRSIS
jgi:hypothetical protein